MPKKKEIPDQLFIKLINDFYVLECNSDPNKLKLPKITEYVNKNGYPKYKVTSLRRNKPIRDYIDSITTAASDNNFKIVASYKTLDIESFLSTNKTHNSLVKALSKLNTYYKTLADAAIQIHNKNKKLEQDINKLKIIIDDLETAIGSYKEQTLIPDPDYKSLIAENKKLRDFIYKYIYPEIANELLSEEGLLKKSDSMINKETLTNSIIKANSSVQASKDIKSHVIKNLFGGFNE